MIERALPLAEAAATRRAAALSAQLAAAIAEDIPGVGASVIDGGVAIEGRGLLRRMLHDGRLRWLEGYVR